jgi:hypothetical protein
VCELGGVNGCLISVIMCFRIFKRAMINSLLYDVNSPCTFAKMHRQQGKFLKQSFLAVPYYRGSTSLGDNVDVATSFGLPLSFFRIHFTTAIAGLPFCRVSWIDFKITEATAYAYIGTMTRDEWITGPLVRDSHNSVQNMYDICSSRYVLGYDKLKEGETTVKCSFLASDPERVNIGNILRVNDLGDNVLKYNSNKSSLEKSDHECCSDEDSLSDCNSISSSVLAFLEMDFSGATASEEELQGVSGSV